MPRQRPYALKPSKRATKKQPPNPAVYRRNAYVGIDFAEDWHDFVILDEHGEVLDDGQIANDQPSIEGLINLLKPYGTPTLPVPVAIEGNADLIVHALHDAGFPVVMIPPYSVNKGRGTFDVNEGKTDRLDAALLANMVRVNQSKWLPWQPDSPATQAMRVAARAEKQEGQRGRKLAQQMRSLLRNGFPAILEEFDTGSLADYKTVGVLRDVPSPTVARSLSVADWDRILKKAGPFQKRAAKAQRLYDLCTAPAVLLHPTLEAAYRERLLLLLDNLDASLTALKKAEAIVTELWAAYPYGDLFEGALNFTPRIGARIFSEIGDYPALYSEPRKLLAYSGFAPVPKSSGKRTGTKYRKAYNRFLHQGVWDWLQAGHNPQATNTGLSAHFMFRRMVHGDTGAQAYRNTGARVIKGIWHCLHTGQAWDDTKVWPHIERHQQALEVMPRLTLSPSVARETNDRKAAYRNAALQAGIRL